MRRFFLAFGSVLFLAVLAAGAAVVPEAGPPAVGGAPARAPRAADLAAPAARGADPDPALCGALVRASLHGPAGLFP